MLAKSEKVTSTANLEDDGIFIALPPKQHPVIRLNAICPYYTMFPLEFPFNALNEAKKGDWVLDPFCGRGTTNFAARLRGLPSIGLDASPVAVAIAKSKFTQVNPSDVVRACSRILKDNRIPESVPAGDFWDLCYHPETLYQIALIREYLHENDLSSEEIALRAIMLGILHGPRMKGKPSYLSNQMPRTYATKPGPAIKFWKNKEEKPNYIDLMELVKRRSAYVFSQIPPIVEGNAYCVDSREIFTEKLNTNFKWIITSPPYYGMRSYLSDQWLRYWFIGGPSDVFYDINGLISHKSITNFISDLAKVWRNVAEVCEPGTHLIVRFGTIPSVKKDPTTIIMDSLQRAGCGWEVSKVSPAGNARKGNRQSDQFLQAISQPCEEIDICAILER
jgi:DNA modification methylase